MARRGRASRIIVAALVVVVPLATYYAVAWNRGDDIRIPGVGIVRRFPCGPYEAVSSRDSSTTQAFDVIDRAAFATQSGARGAVRTLVHVVFDRELPMVRCGNRLRDRVAEAEWQFRRGAHPSITEAMLVAVANEVLATENAPAWARASVQEVHLLRAELRPMLPQLVGSVDRQLTLHENMSPVEAVFIAMTLGKSMMWEPEEFYGGPEAYLERVRERQLHPPTPRAVLVAPHGRELISDLDVPTSALARAAERFLDQLGFPR